MTKVEYEKSLEKLLDKIIYCESNRQIYKRLTELCGIGKKYEDVAKQGDMFFGMIVHNLLNELLMELSRMYDEDRENKAFSLIKMKNIAEQNQEWFIEHCDKNDISRDEIKKLFVELNEIYANIQNSRKTIITIRDKYLAHFDKRYVLNSEELYQNLSWGDVEDLINCASTMVNRVTCLLNGQYTMVDWIGDSGVDNLIRAAHKGLNMSD